MFMNNRTYLVAVQILFIIKVISQYWYSWNLQNNPLMKFVKKINVVKAPFHGKTFNGNEINKILKKNHILEKIWGFLKISCQLFLAYKI